MMDNILSSGERRELSHARIYTLWQAAKHGEEFSGEDALHVKAMREHPEFYNTWEHATEFLEEKVIVNGVNPFLHIYMHSIVENQVIANNPPEVCALFESDKLHGIPRHQTVHEISDLFLEFIFRVIRERQPFDMDDYRRRLTSMMSDSQRYQPSSFSLS